MIDGPPEIACLTVDPNEGLVQVPPPLDMLPSDLLLPVAKLSCNDGSEAVPPEPDGLVADIDPTLMQQIFDLAQPLREPHAEQDRRADHRRRAIEIAKRVRHPDGLRRPQQNFSNNAFHEIQ